VTAERERQRKTLLRSFLSRAFISGLLIAVPGYLAVLLVLRGMRSVARLVRPLAALHPPGVTAEAAQEDVLALCAVLLICLALGVVVLTPPGRAARECIERSVLERIPGYTLARSLAKQVAGQTRENVWKPALAEMGYGLVFAFIIEENSDGRYTVFIPSVPSVVVGSVYIFPRERVHLLNASFAQAFQVLSRWGSGAQALAATIQSALRDRPLDSKSSSDPGERTRRAAHIPAAAAPSDDPAAPQIRRH
jgi:uncharacterized membrane protein